MRPRRSVWSTPHNAGTFFSQRLCTFRLHADPHTNSVTIIYTTLLNSCKHLDTEVAEHVLLIMNNQCITGEAIMTIGTNQKRTYDFLLVINSNLSPILHRFRDTMRL